MKGETTIIVTKEQMIDIAGEWWAKITYSSGSSVSSVEKNNTGGFVIILNEVVKTDDES